MTSLAGSASPSSSSEGLVRPVHELFANQAGRLPGALAVVAPDCTLTYAELEKRSNQLAHRLRTLGVGPESPVGLCLERSAALAVATLGILKAGGAYIALDPAHPNERLRFMLEDSGALAAVTRAGMVPQLGEAVADIVVLDTGLSALDDEPAVTLSATTDGGSERLAYIIYTSGSTGSPKGVLVEHGSLLNLVRWHQRAFSVTEDDRGTQIASPGFDAVVWELWPYLTIGASVHVPDEPLRADPSALRDWLVESRITVSFVPTALAEELIGLDWPADTSLRHLLTGGDVLRLHPQRRIPFELVNNYGPTEATVVATSGIVPRRGEGSDDAGAPSIGRPIDGVRLHIVDEAMNPVVPGGSGELLIGGASVARGYLNLPELTAARFTTDVFSGEPGARLYHTGDIVRGRPDGDIEFVGRTDEQVKVLGQRVELGEITAALNTHPAVRTSVVIAIGGVAGQTRLVACMVAAEEPAPDVAQLRSQLSAVLPEQMIPSDLLWVRELPMTASHKVDRAALATMVLAQLAEAAAEDSPNSELEELLARIVADLLGLETVAVHENFFLLGGHSLLGAQLITRITDRFGVDLPLRAVFERPTVAEMAAAVEALLVADVDALSEEEAAALAAEMGSAARS
ncbi:MAG: non-ribosomal peptide synthetase [Candidatus Dormibacteria bacterium]